MKWKNVFKHQIPIIFYSGSWRESIVLTALDAHFLDSSALGKYGSSDRNIVGKWVIIIYNNMRFPYNEALVKYWTRVR